MSSDPTLKPEGGGTSILGRGSLSSPVFHRRFMNGRTSSFLPLLLFLEGSLSAVAGAPEEPTEKLRPDDVITFTDEDARKIQTPHDDAVVVSETIANYDVRRIFVNNESSTNILFYSTFSRMRLSADRLERVSTPLVGFAREAVTVEGEVTLPVIAGTEPRQSTVHLTFAVV